ncbi:MAG: ABC transporter permease [Blastocatellia bacterium]|nr:ABC transporter permease [Blastocatellia bacterium]
MAILTQDMRYAVRLLKKNIGFTIATISVLALGIGAVAAIFSIVNAVLLRPLPYKDPDNLVVIWETQPKTGNIPTSAANFWDWQTQSQAFEAMAAYSAQNFNLTNLGDPERIDGAVVSANFFQIFAVNPLIGYTFTPETLKADGDRYVVISEGLWKRRFGSNPNVVGQTLTLNDTSFKICAVMSSALKFPDKAELWISPKREVPEPPIAIEGDILKMRQVYYLSSIGRIKNGTSISQAQSNMDSIARTLAEQYPDTNQEHGIRLVPLSQEIVGEIRPTLLTFLGVVAFVLLIACSNVANLLLGRAVDRQKEFGIRIALGASRLRIVQQLLTESVVLALIAGLFGLLLADSMIKLVITITPVNIPRVNEISLDAAVVGVTLLISLLTGVLFGLAPVMQTLKNNTTESLKEGGRGGSDGPSRQRLRKTLVVTEVALSLVLLVGAGLMIRSFYRLQSIDLGFTANNVITLQISLPRTKYVEKHQMVGFYDQALKEIESIPGVKTVGITNRLPLTGKGLSGEFFIKGYTSTAGEKIMADRRMVNTNYFSTIGVALKSGRLFTSSDLNGSGVVVINEAAAKRFWANESPVGKQISFDPSSTEWLEIVGVVGNMRGADIYTEPAPEIYTPYFQTPWHNMTFVVKVAPASPDIVPFLRTAISTVDKNQPIYNIRPLETIVEESASKPRFGLIMITLFAAAALILAAIGLYGVMSASVLQRKHEIGIRLALGAQPGDILKMILSQGMGLVLVGIGIGLVLAFILSKTISSLLYEITSLDPITYLLVSSFLLLMTLLASSLPAYRAMKISPMSAHRYE